MAELGPLEIICALARMLAIGAGILFGLALFSILWLYLSELRHKKTWRDPVIY
ncbi:MAG TPA: hypothetical protein VMW46_07555 [Candidatus Desulfaltia sp.]|nr:hypothetical protein [Candidatus Desulfaltia sp.]